MRDKYGINNRKSKPKEITNKKKEVPDKNWGKACQCCGSYPTVRDTGLCGPCCFGEAETIGGNW